MLEVYKILNGFEGIEINKLFKLKHDHYAIRGHNYKLEIPHIKLNLRKKFFSVRVLQAWNDLPAHVVNQPSVNHFKNSIDHFMKTAQGGGVPKGYVQPTHP